MFPKASLICAALIAITPGPSGAHDIYGSLKNRRGGSCCNGSDCRPVPYRIVGGSVQMLVDGTWFVTTSRGRFRLGSVWVGRPGRLAERRHQLPVGPEDITYWPQRDQLWSLSEYPHARFVFAMPRRRLLR